MDPPGFGFHALKREMREIVKLAGDGSYPLNLGYFRHHKEPDLASAASIGISTVRRLEATGHGIRGSTEVLWKIQTAFEAAGVEFIPADETKGPGVRLKKRQR